MEPRPRLSRIAPWLLGLLVVLVALRAALPFVVARVAADRLSEALGGRATVADVDLWLLFGAVQVDGLAVAPAEGGPPWLASDRAELDLDLWQLVRGNLHAQELALGGVRLVLVRNRDGEITWPGRGRDEESPASSEPEPAPAEASEPLTLAVDVVSLREIELTLRDEIGERELRVQLGPTRIGPVGLRLDDPLDWSADDVHVESTLASLVNDDASSLEATLTLDARDLSSAEQEPGQLEATLRVGGGSLEARGSIRFAPLSLDMAFDWKDLELAPLTALAPRADRPQVKSGSSRGRFELQVGDRGPESADVRGGLSGRGEIAVDALDLSLRAPIAADVAWKSLELGLDSLSVPSGEGQSLAIHLKKLDLVAPAVRVARARPAAGSEPAPAGDGGEAAPPHVTIDQLRVSDGRVAVSDATFDPPLDSAVSGISLEARGLAWPERRAEKLDLAVASLGKTPLTLTARSDGARGSGSLHGDRISLLIANPYVRQSSSYAIQSGTLSIDSRFEFEGASYDAPTHVVLHDFDVRGGDAGSRFQQEFGVPLDLALVLLRDTSGDIALDLPIESRGESAGVGLTRVVATTFRRVLVNALASPLKVAGLVVAGRGSAESFAGRALEYQPGEAVRSDTRASREQTEELVRLLAEKPDLGIRLEVVMVPADLERVARAASIEPGTPAAPSAEAVRRLETLARERLEESRGRVLEAISGLADAGSRVTIVPWSGRLGSGEPRVVAQLVLRSSS